MDSHEGLAVGLLPGGEPGGRTRQGSRSSRCWLILREPARFPDPPSVPGVQSVSGSVPLAAVAGSTASVVPVAEAAVSDISSISANTIQQAPSAGQSCGPHRRPSYRHRRWRPVPATAGAVPAILPTTGQGAPSASGGSGSPALAHVGNQGVSPPIDRKSRAATGRATGACPVAWHPDCSESGTHNSVPVSDFPDFSAGLERCQ